MTPINLTIDDDDAVGLRVAEGGGSGGGAVWSVDGKVGDVTVLPTGGTQGQVLKKASGTNYDVEWANESGGGGSSPSPSSATPQPLGTAAAGSSTDYSRADHVHAMPSASDVGAYALPSGGVPIADLATAVLARMLPTGGSEGQVLRKASGTDYDVQWALQVFDSAYCLTGGGTAAKKAYLNNYTLTANTWVQVLMSSANSYNGAITLNINSKGDKPIYINGSASSSSNKTLPAGSYFVYYDGTNYHFRTDGKLPGVPYTAADVGAEPAVAEVTISSTGDVTQALDAGKIYHFTGSISSLTLTLNATTGVPHYHFDFNSGSTAATISLSGVTWPSGSFTPEASKHYEVDILNGYGVTMAW